MRQLGGGDGEGGEHATAPDREQRPPAPGHSAQGHSAQAHSSAWESGEATPPALLLVASSGGHLAQLLALRPWYRHRHRRWVTFDTPDAQSLLADESVVWAHHPTTRHLGNLLRNAVLAVRHVRRGRVAAVITTGAGVAFPFVLQARLRGIPSVYIEVYDRIDSPTLTARLCRPFVSAMLVQWEEQRRFYPEATVVGRLL